MLFLVLYVCFLLLFFFVVVVALPACLLDYLLTYLFVCFFVCCFHRGLRLGSLRGEEMSTVPQTNIHAGKNAEERFAYLEGNCTFKRKGAPWK